MASSGNTEPEKSKISEDKTGDEKTKDTEEKISDVSSGESDDDKDSTGGTTHSAGRPIVKIFMTRQVPYQFGILRTCGFQKCVTLNLFTALILSYEQKCDF